MTSRWSSPARLTGGIHGKEANPNLPEQPDEIVAQGIAAWRAGAAILHVHARNPDGSNTMDPAIYGELHERLCAETDAIVQLTTGGSPRLPVEERLNTVLLAPEMCSLNMGLLNFFIRGEQVFFANHRSDIERFAHEMRARGVKPELEVYSAAMLEEAAAPARARRSSSRRTSSTSCCTRRPRAARAARRTTCSTWSPGCGRSTCRGRTCASTSPRWAPTQLPITTIAMAMGFNVRVGMEDNVSSGAASRCANNAQLVERTVRIAAELDRPPATPEQARELLGTRGREAGALP